MARNPPGKKGSPKPRASHASSPIDPLQIFATADSFFQVGAILVREGNIDATAPLRLGAAYAVNMALSIELFLKCLKVIEGSRPPRTHNLKELFKLIKPSYQNTIRSRFNKEASETVPKFIAITPKEHGHEERFVRMADFDKALESSANAFEAFRYQHEAAPGDFFVPSLAAITRDLIKEIKPEWFKPKPSHK